MGRTSGTIEIQGIDYVLPTPPKNPKDYLYHDKTKADQRWEVEELPDTLDHMTPEEAQEFMNREWERLLNGVWFMNFGKKIYLTGCNYFYLRYFKLDSGELPEFRWDDTLLFYFIDFVEKNNKLSGFIMVKPRRVGMSAKASAYALYTAIVEENCHIGLISKSSDDGKRLFQDMIINGFSGLPTFIKPMTSGTDRAAKELVFMKQAERMRKDMRVATSGYKGLNNKISYRSTALTSYDGYRLRCLIADESAKFPTEVSIAEYWNIARKTLKTGGRKNGIAILLSTVGEMTKGGGKAYKTVWDESDQTKFGMDTPSGLIQYFLPTTRCFTGYIDKYGFSIEENPTEEQKKWMRQNDYCPDAEKGCREYLMEGRAKLTNPESINAEKRQQPFTVKEAFLLAATDCIYNPDHINEQIQTIEELNIKTRKVNFYKHSQTGRAYWMEEPNGRWDLLWDFQDSSKDSNKFTTDRKGWKVPANTAHFSIGLDQFSSTTTVSSKGSNAGGYVFRKLNLLDPENSDMPILQYLSRPKLKSIMWNDFALAAQYFGCKIGIEQIGDFEWFTENGYENYLISTPDALLAAHGKKKLGIPMTAKPAIELHTTYTREYMVHNWRKIFFRELLEQMLDFDPADRTKSDGVMGFGYSLICASETTQQIVPKKFDQPIVKTYKLVS